MSPDAFRAVVAFAIALAVPKTFFFATRALWAIQRVDRAVRARGVTAVALGALVVSACAAPASGTRRDEKVQSAAGSPASATPATAQRLDGARSQWAEARGHYARIMLLVRNLKNAEAGAEMLASAEHLERGFRDAGQEPDSRTVAVLRDARAGAERLIRDGGPVPLSIGIAIEALGAELNRLEGRVPARGVVAT